LFDITYRQTGMFGVIARLQECWAERRAPGLSRAQIRWSYEACGAFDMTASSMQQAAIKERLQIEPLEYLVPYLQDQRMQVFRQFASEGLVPSAHRRALSRTADTWFVVMAAAERPRSMPPSLPGARPVGAAGGTLVQAYMTEPPIQPTYPDAARRAQETGDVTLLLRVAEDGRVIVVDVDRSSGFGALDDAARLTAFRWRFQPAKRDGMNVAAFMKAVAVFTTGPGNNARSSMRLVTN
jgi:TonB family protein